MKAAKDPNRRVLLILFLGVLMGALDIAIVGPALNPIKVYFGASGRVMTWIFTIYILMNLVATPLLAKLSDQYGRKPLYLFSIVLFGMGSLVVASSGTIGMVIFGRAIQGFGAGGIFPVASAVIGDTFPPEKRGKALGLIGAVFGIAFIIGPVVGGTLLMIGWQAIFLINLPVSLVLLYLAGKYLPVSSKLKKAPFDFTGTLITSLMLGSFVFGVNNLDTGHLLMSFLTLKVYPFLIAAAILMIALIAVEKKSKNPIISPTLFHTRQLNITHALAFGAGFGEVSLVYLPMLAISAFGVSSSASSFMLIPCVMAMAVGAPSFGRMLDRKGSKRVILIGTITLTIGMLMLASFTNKLAAFYITTVVIGFGLSALLGAPLRYILLNETDANNRSSAQGLMTIFGSAGQLISAAVIGAVISSGKYSVMSFSQAYLLIGVFLILLVGLSLLLKNKAQESLERR